MTKHALPSSATDLTWESSAQGGEMWTLPSLSYEGWYFVAWIIWPSSPNKLNFPII